MRVALIFPRFRYPSGDPPMGVAYLAALAEAEGVEVDVLDCTFQSDPLAYLEERLSRKSYDLVGLSLMTVMLQDTRRLLPVVRRLQPKAKVILGGPHPTVEPESSLQLPGVDAVVLGEGEATWREILQAGGKLEGIAGVWTRRGDEVIKTPPRAPLASLDELPLPAWHKLEMRRYMRSWFQLDAVGPNLTGTSIMASRGCPFHCSYCQPTLKRLFGPKVRWRSVPHVLNELEVLQARYRPHGLMWLDDTFTVNKKWVHELCEGVRTRKLHFLWGCNMRADTVTRDLLADMQSAGLVMVHLGIESGSQRVLDEIYRKGITLEQVHQAVAEAKSLGLYVRGYFMLGAPTETVDEILATIRLACELDLDDASFSLTTPFPHTYLWDFSKQYLAEDFEHFDYYKVPPYKPGATVKPELLQKLRRYALLKFYLHRKRLWRTLKSVSSPLGVHKNLLKIRRF